MEQEMSRGRSVVKAEARVSQGGVGMCEESEGHEAGGCVGEIVGWRNTGAQPCCSGRVQRALVDGGTGSKQKGEAGLLLRRTMRSLRQRATAGRQANKIVCTAAQNAQQRVAFHAYHTGTRLPHGG